jgi:type II secretory pathway component GspD/PulD (secretin)
VLPTINPDGFVTMEVEPEVSSIGAPVQISGDLTAVSFQRTRLSTIITIKDGETVIIGGLIETNLTESETKVPLLGDLPGIGQLFRSNSDSRRGAELLVVITATVIRSVEDAYLVSVQQRDQTDIIPDSIKTSPLMKKLQVRPGEDVMHIQEKELLKQPEPRRYYGPPPPKDYGPPPPNRSDRIRIKT